jgi:site-specific recombinase XerD
MTELREKMIRAMELHNLSKNTQRRYVASVSGVSKHYMLSPVEVTKEMIQNYFLHLKQVKGQAPTTIGSIISGLRFFYNHVAGQEDQTPSCTLKKKPTQNVPYAKWVNLPKTCTG